MGSMAFLNHGIYPDRLKFAIVRLIYQKGEKTDVANYRSTSLITTLAEILEKLVYSRLSQHLNVNKILTLKQFGFEKIDTNTAIYPLTDVILKALNKHIQIVGIFCDIAKAFESVNRDILPEKLCYYGIQFLWFRSYLENIRQRVETLHNEFGETSSGWETIKNGVPQGYILSPLLFLLYINDLPLGINIDFKLLLYSDDTSILISGPNIQEALSKSLIARDIINKWCMTNCLS